MLVKKSNFFNKSFKLIIGIGFFFLLLVITDFSLADNTSSALKGFFQKQYSHTLRVASTVIRLLGDSKFLAQNPEYKSIAERAKDTLKVALTHDKAKGLNTSYNEVLAQSDGIDYRSLPEGDPKKLKIMNAIKQLNEQDDAFWKKAMRKFSSSQRKLLDQLVGAADYSDVPMSRRAEFGNGIRKIEKASDWIPQLNNLDPDVKKGMTRVARYIEDNPKNFADIYTNVTVKNLPPNKTVAYIKFLKKNAKKIQSAVTPSTSPAFRALGAVGVLMIPSSVAANYVMDPVFSKPADDFVEMISSSSELAKCQTLGCSQVFKECKEKKLNEEDCFSDFFKKPLHEQTRLRLNDDLDLILKSKAPLITEVSCAKSTTPPDIIKFSTLNYNNELQEQELSIDTESKIQMVNISLPHGELRPADSIRFIDGRPNILILYQKPLVSKYETDPEGWSSLVIPKKDWKDEEMYFWTMRSKEQKEQIKRSQEALRSIQRQKSSILECCHDNKCLDYYAHLKNARQKNKEKERVASSFSTQSVR